ncbi:MAG: thymidine kinase [Deltaproteobacteria bacterium]|nr:thymidine kinase [Deltaproteobacteria bacterium]
MHQTPIDTGWVEVICGPMFSGKTEELIRRLRRAELARQKVQSFKPSRDNRYDATQIVSHSQQRRDGHAVESSADLRAAVLPDVQVIGIDEVQFFDAGIVEVVDTLATQGKRVLVAGLDQDYLGRPFEPMPQLLAIAEYITKTLAICMVCGNPAGRSQRLVQTGDRVLVGSHDSYEARCRKCYDPAAGKETP